MEISPREPSTAFNPPKIVEAAMEVPIVQTTYSSIATMAAPLSLYLEVPVASLTTGAATLKTKAETSVLPHVPTMVNSCCSSALDTATNVLSTLDSMAADRLNRLLDAAPVLRKQLPELYEDTKNSAGTKVFQMTAFIASFTLCQVALKVADSSLATTDSVAKVIGINEMNLLVRGLRLTRSTATEVRREGAKINGDPKLARIDDASLVGALAELSGLLDILGLRLKVELTELNSPGRCPPFLLN